MAVNLRAGSLGLHPGRNWWIVARCGVSGAVESSWVVLKKTRGCSVTSCEVKGGKLRKHRVKEDVL